MTFFIIKRKSDGKTDAIVEYNFKSGKFVGKTGEYTYNDIEYFNGVSSVLLKEMLGEKPKATKQEKEEKVEEKAE